MFEPPYLLARRLSTLDHLTKGRVAWNVVSSYLNSAALNIGMDKQIGHDERYDIAEEYMEVMYKLWEGSWEDGAVHRNKETGVFTDGSKVHPIQHNGKYFKGPRLPLVRAVSAAHSGDFPGWRIGARPPIRVQACRRHVHPDDERPAGAEDDGRHPQSNRSTGSFSRLSEDLHAVDRHHWCDRRSCAAEVRGISFVCEPRGHACAVRWLDRYRLLEARSRRTAQGHGQRQSSHNTRVAHQRQRQGVDGPGCHQEPLHRRPRTRARWWTAKGCRRTGALGRRRRSRWLQPRLCRDARNDDRLYRLCRARTAQARPRADVVQGRHDARKAHRHEGRQRREHAPGCSVPDCIRWQRERCQQNDRVKVLGRHEGPGNSLSLALRHI
ncbi:MAG: LLM class flavin-dependent oxidoreductase [Hyphomicrobium sp.]|nr:LLM class flavin-dependent oxidoreductase [Hyphomicrobium sp.]